MSKLSEEELDSWFIELPLCVKQYIYSTTQIKSAHVLHKTDWDDIFKCESNTPETLADKEELSEFYNMAVNKYCL